MYISVIIHKPNTCVNYTKAPALLKPLRFPLVTKMPLPAPL